MALIHRLRRQAGKPEANTPHPAVKFCSISQLIMRSRSVVVIKLRFTVPVYRSIRITAISKGHEFISKATECLVIFVVFVDPGLLFVDSFGLNFCILIISFSFFLNGVNVVSGRISWSVFQGRPTHCYLLSR